MRAGWQGPVVVGVRPARSDPRRTADGARGARWPRTATSCVARAGRALRRRPRVWCSWYHYFEDVTADDVVENLARLRRSTTWRVDVVQIDDGWSPGLGEGLARVGAVRVAARRWSTRIRDTGRRAGIWLAPFLVGADTDARPRAPRLAGRRRPAATGARTLAGLDLTHPAVRDLLAGHVRRLVDGWASTTSSWTSSTPARCPGAGTTTSTPSRRTGPGWSWSARWSEPEVYLRRLRRSAPA